MEMLVGVLAFIVVWLMLCRLIDAEKAIALEKRNEKEGKE
jgi:hypothetical protein